MDLVLREATADDAERVLALVSGVIARRPVDIPMEPDELPWTLADERDILARYARHPRALFLLAESDEQIIGQLSIRSGDLASMRHAASLGMCVAHDDRNRGVGRSLLREALRWAHTAPGLTRLHLDVYARNVPARRLYEAAGFAYETHRRCAIVEHGRALDCHGMGLLFQDKQPEPVEQHVPAYEPATSAAVDAPWRVRDALPADAEEICRLQADMRRDSGLFVPSAALGFTADVEARRRRIDEAARGSNSHVLVAESDTGIIASVEAEGGRLRALQHEAYVAIDVADGWRGRGIGRALLERLYDRARSAGVLRRLALVVYAENAPAIGLYESCGFEHEGRRRNSFFQRDRFHDDLLMARILD